MSSMTTNEAREILGLEAGADINEDVVKKAFRSKSKTAHPDGGGSAEAFQKLQEAADLLAGNNNGSADDDILRGFGDGWRGASSTVWSTGDRRTFSDGGVEWTEIFMAPGGFTADEFRFARNGARTHHNVRQIFKIEHVIPFMECVPGAERRFEVRFPDGRERAVSFVIPDDIMNEMRVRIPDPDGAWDIIATIYVWPPAEFAVAGRDLVHERAITGIEACIGGEFMLAHPAGQQWSVKIPAGIKDGKTVRLKGKGVAGQGDLHIVFRIRATDLSEFRDDIEAVLAGNLTQKSDSNNGDVENVVEVVADISDDINDDVSDNIDDSAEAGEQ